MIWASAIVFNSPVWRYLWFRVGRDQFSLCKKCNEDWRDRRNQRPIRRKVLSVGENLPILYKLGLGIKNFVCVQYSNTQRKHILPFRDHTYTTHDEGLWGTCLEEIRCTYLFVKLTVCFSACITTSVANIAVRKRGMLRIIIAGSVMKQTRPLSFVNNQRSPFIPRGKARQSRSIEHRMIAWIRFISDYAEQFPGKIKYDGDGRRGRSRRTRL